jgi:hypothetical protein
VEGGSVTTRPTRTTRSRTTFAKDAIKYVERCARDGAPWEQLEPKVDGAFEMAGFEMTQTESMAIYDAWDAAYPWAETAA